MKHFGSSAYCTITLGILRATVLLVPYYYRYCIW